VNWAAKDVPARLAIKVSGRRFLASWLRISALKNIAGKGLDTTNRQSDNSATAKGLKINQAGCRSHKQLDFEGGNMGKKLFGNVLLLSLLFLTLGMQTGQEVYQVLPKSEAPSVESGPMTDETPTLWFVELASPPLTDGGAPSTLAREKDDFRARARKAKLVYAERYAFDNLWNGLSVDVSPKDLQKLSRIEGVRGLYPVMAIPLPKIDPGENYIELYTALSMTGASVAQSELGFTGQGVRVGIIDTGIDYHHPDLGGGFGPGYRVETGWDFVGDIFGTTYVPIPDPDPDDCHGHGTHVAGIVGANGIVRGVAPNVTFGAYRVFGCSGSTYSDIMIAAMERALADGMDIVNMSIGNAFQWPQYPTAVASDRLVNQGVVVVAAAGNDGAAGLYSAGAPGVGDKVIDVASFVNNFQNAPVFTVSPDNLAVAFNGASGSPYPPSSGSYPLARTGTPASVNDACNPLPAGSLTGKAALIRRGTCTFYTKAMNAFNAGAVGVVLYNNAAGTLSPSVAGTPAVTIPVVGITQSDGLIINGRIAAGPVMLNWTTQMSSTPIAAGGLIASSSSYGLTAELGLKPDIGAPGGTIRSTYPKELGEYATMSGTSMASPHVAGAVALLLEAKPRTPAQAVRGILQTSAFPKLWAGNPGLGFLDNVHRQGAGMLQIDDAILATTKIEPGKLELGEGAAGPAVRTLTVENNGSSPVVYDLSYVNALSTGGLITPTFWASDASVTFEAPSVVGPAHSSVIVDVTIHPATGPEYGQYGGYIVFTPQGGGQIYRVPFAGFVGDYQSIIALSPTSNGFPWLATLVGSSYYTQPAGATYTMAGNNIPFILVHLDHQVRRLRMEAFNADTGKAWHRVYDFGYYQRSTTPTSFFSFAWDGTTANGSKTYTVPNGRYVIRLSVLKALGDDNNPAHWEAWTSPVITIAR